MQTTFKGSSKRLKPLIKYTVVTFGLEGACNLNLHFFVDRYIMYSCRARHCLCYPVVYVTSVSLMKSWLHEEEECGYGLTQDAQDVNAHNIQWLYLPNRPLYCNNSLFYDQYNLYTIILQTTMGKKSLTQG